MHAFPQESRPDLHTNEPTLLKVKRIALTIFFCVLFVNIQWYEISVSKTTQMCVTSTGFYHLKGLLMDIEDWF